MHTFGCARVNTFCAGVYAYGFERPSAIQQRAIMPVIKGTSKEFCGSILQ